MLRNKIYYGLKPVIPRRLRMGIRRQLAVGTRERAADVWPIAPGSEHPPENWSGWPNGKQFAVVLTHDVERQGGLDKCPALMDAEQEMGFHSGFSFIPEGTYRVPPSLREELVRNGCEVAVHDLHHDGRLYRTRREFNEKAKRINHYLHEWGAVGFRSGFMLNRLEWLHELDAEYDMSTFDTDPFEPQPDGRHTIFPFLVNPAEPMNGHGNPGRQGYVELPYTLPQDSTLFLLLRETTPAIWFRKLDWIASHGGMVLVNTHPDYMSFGCERRNSMEYPIALYQDLLRYINDRYAGAFWPALPRDVARFFRQSQADKTAGLTRDPDRASPHVRSAESHTLEASRPFTGSPKEAASVASSDGSLKQSGYSRDSPQWSRLRGKRAAVLLFSHYPADPRPRRAAEALAEQGVTVDLICLQEDTNEPRHEQVNGVNVLRVPLKRRRRGKITYAWQYSAFIIFCFGWLALRSLGRRYDFVHVHNMPDILVFSAIVPKVFGAKVLLDLHDPMPELMQSIFNLPAESGSVRLLKAMEKSSIAFSDHVLTVSRTFQNLFSSRSCRPEKITVVLNAPDERIFPFQPPEPRTNGTSKGQPFVVLYHGSLLRRNGLDLAVDALQLVRQEIPAAILHVCGKPTPFFDQVMADVEKLGLTSAVQYLGGRDLSGIVEAIRACDVGVIPNHRNMFTELNTPTRIFECLALGKPIVAPRARGIQEYFGADDLIYFELGNSADLAEKIKYVYFHPQEVRETVTRGQRIYQRHTWRAEKANLLNAFTSAGVS